jgi:uncharacterized protein
MAVALYDVTVASFLQTLGAVAGFLDKGANHCAADGTDPNEIVAARLHPDMLPFPFQIVSVAHHSLGAVKGVEAGVFAPPTVPPGLDYAGLQNLVSQARQELQGYSRDAVEAFAGRDVIFQIGDRKMPFSAENFLISFSLPNFYFHAATAYDILRMKGVAIGKRDFMGQLRMKTG